MRVLGRPCSIGPRLNSISRKSGRLRGLPGVLALTLCVSRQLTRYEPDLEDDKGRMPSGDQTSGIQRTFPTSEVCPSAVGLEGTHFVSMPCVPSEMLAGRCAGTYIPIWLGDHSTTFCACLCVLLCLDREGRQVIASIYIVHRGRYCTVLYIHQYIFTVP